jgi:hypothetical protein
MTDWFARPVLHVAESRASLRFHVNQLGSTNPGRYDQDGKGDFADTQKDLKEAKKLREESHSGVSNSCEILSHA